jgi:hypothetical protein
MSEVKWSITPEQRVELLAAVREAKESTAQGRYLAAKATGIVVALEAIGEGRTYATQGDYAAALGVSAATITGLKYLAVAVELGLTPAHPGWAVCSSKAGNLGPAVKDPKRSLAKIVKAAKAAKAKDEHAAAAKAAAKAKADAAPTVPDAKAKPGPATERVAALEEATEALETLRRVMSTLLAADRTAVRNSLVTLTSEYGAPVAPEAKAS